jgi:uncharacterized protein YndB with AHSA1/START domain
MPTILLLLLLAALALLLVYASTRPDHFRIQRTKVIKAPATRIFALINNLESFNHWNPYLRKDPGMRGSYSGPASGVGAGYAWEGKRIGAGRMEIIASEAPGRVALTLDFDKPLKAHNTAEFTLQAEGDSTTIVTWALFGPSPYLSKLMGVVFGMERRVGKDFEAGLANLKALTEGR